MCPFIYSSSYHLFTHPPTCLPVSPTICTPTHLPIYPPVEACAPAICEQRCSHRGTASTLPGIGLERDACPASLDPHSLSSCPQPPNSLKSPELQPPPFQPQSRCALPSSPVRPWSPWPRQAAASLPSAPEGGHVALTVCCGDISGWLGCVAGKIHQPASSALASPDRVLICQSVGFLHMNSSIFVSGKIAFVFLCRLIHPCRPLSLAFCVPPVRFRNRVQGVISQTPHGLCPSRLLGP